jgi:hypothetical protein
MLIDLRKTKITFSRDEEPHPCDFVEKVENEDEIIATPVAILVDPNAKGICMNRLSCSQEIDEEVNATPVEVYPL